MNQADIVAARRFMAGEPHALELGAKICASCGVDRATERIGKAMNSTFNQTQWLVCDSVFVCRPCLDIFTDKTSRSKCLFFPEPGKKVILAREEILPLLACPPEKTFVLCLPYSFQKHVFFYAGISSSRCAWIGTDDHVVKLDYEKHDITAVIAQIGEMLTKGVPRKELQSGRYSIFTKAKLGRQLDEWEAALAPLRPDGAIELFVLYSPATKEKIKTEIKPVAFSETEDKAIDILLDLARASKYRTQDGMSFWGSYFKRRITRNLRKPELHSFFSAVAAGIDCESTGLKTSGLEALNADTAAKVLKEIREKTDLLVAAVYTRLKTDKPQKRKSNEMGSFF